MQLLRSLELAELRATMRFESRVIQGFPFLERDDGDGAFAPSLVRNADHGDLAHLRQLVDHALDLRRGDILAAADDHVLLAIGDVKESLLVEIADVAGSEPVAEEA